MTSIRNSKKATLYALFDLAQHEFGQHIIANAPLGIAFEPQLLQEGTSAALYNCDSNTITLNKALYKDANYLEIIQTLAHEMVHGTQDAHGRTNTYLCSPTEYIILNKV